MRRILNDLLHLVYPNLCVGCHEEPVDNNELFCVTCEVKLPITDFHLVANNEAINRMGGDYKFVSGVSMFRFYPGGIVQNMIHEIKYRGQTNIARRLGRRYGEVIRKTPIYQNVNCIIPIPLHPSKLRSRGYNQSTFFADGLSRALNCPVGPDYLKRVVKTETQTSKTRYERIKSMLEAFRVSDKASDLKNKHVLLVDDVLTTGATLQSCALALTIIPGVKISFATIALAQ